MDVVLLVDGSGSIKSYNFQRLKAFLVRFVRSFNIGFYNTRVSVVQFSRSSRVEFYLKRYRRVQDIISAINRIRQMRRGTYLHVGLKMVRSRVFKRWSGDRAGVPNTLVILTDGGTSFFTYARAEALRLQRQGVHVLTVGIGNRNTVRRFSYQLKTYASRPLRQNLFLHGFSGLRKFARRLAVMSCRSK